MAPPGGHMFYIGLIKRKHEKIFLSETTGPRALIFGNNNNNNNNNSLYFQRVTHLAKKKKANLP